MFDCIFWYIGLSTIWDFFWKSRWETFEIELFSQKNYLSSTLKQKSRFHLHLMSFLSRETVEILNISLVIFLNFFGRNNTFEYSKHIKELYKWCLWHKTRICWEIITRLWCLRKSERSLRHWWDFLWNSRWDTWGYWSLFLRRKIWAVNLTLLSI